MEKETEEPVMSRLGTAFTRLSYVNEIPICVNLNIKDYEEIKQYLLSVSGINKKLSHKPYDTGLSSGIEINTINVLGKELSVEVEISNNQKSILISKKGMIQKF